MSLLSPTHYYTVPGLKWIGHLLPRGWLFHSGRVAAAISVRLNPHTHRLVKPVREILALAEVSKDAHHTVQRYVTYRKYLSYLERTWAHSAVRDGVPARIIGQEYLDQALAQGRGAILVSGHAYGFNRLVAPVLGRQGYRVIRGGMVTPENLKGLAGDNPRDPWTYIYLGNDRWERLRALKRITTSLNKNELLHTLVTGDPGADDAAGPGMVRFCSHRFSLDLPTFRFLSELKRAILPCFALCDERGQLIIKLHPPISSDMPAIADEFTNLYQSYLNESPEFVRFWKRLLTRKGFL